jgi:hypothetical protein
MAAVIAMLFLVLFATLAVGFLVTTEMSSQIAGNEQKLGLARMSADSGMEFIRYQLGSITLPSGTNSSNILANTANQLASLPALSSAANMGANTVSVNNGTIYIPSQTGWMTLDSSLQTRFQVAITQISGTNTLLVTTHGGAGSSTMTRGIQLQYSPTQGNSSILNYGIAAHGPISLSGNAIVTGASNAAQGSVLSATATGTPLTMSGNVSISGDFSDTNASGTLSMSGNIKIGGYSPSNPNFTAHVHKGITVPVFPTVDTSIYLPYATSTYASSSGANITVVNAIIPPNTNPTFSGNTTIQGVLYIKTPNRVSFSGNVTIQGAIVVENNPTGSNTMNFSGNVSATSMGTLPATAQFPAGERALTGAFLLAPSYAVSMSGNFGTIGGSLVADSFTFSGNAGGEVDGSVIALKDIPFTESGNSPFVIGIPVSGIPAGIVFPGGFGAVQGSYIEVP